MKFVILFVLSACAFAQSIPPADQIEGLLRSRSLRDKAWGAWFAGASRNPSLLGAVLQQLRLVQPQVDSQPNSEEYSGVQTLLDAVIQLPGKVPADAILPFAHSWLPEVLIILSRNPGEPGIESALLEFREHSAKETEWVAVNDLLFAGNSTFFFQRILGEIRLKHNFLIDDQNGFRADNGSIGCGGTAHRLAIGFPPAGLYQLIVNPIPGDVVFEVSPIRMYYRRTVVPTDGQVELTDCQFHPAAVERQFHLAQILGVIDNLSPSEAASRFQPETWIRWQDSAEKATSEIENLVAVQTAAIRSMVERMRARGQLPWGVAPPVIEVTIRDIRRDRSVPLEGLGTREVAVEPSKLRP